MRVAAGAARRQIGGMTEITHLLPDPSACWGAVLARDPAADGLFCYGVRSTGIYCRPTCRARLPRRENVSFHASPAAAEAAGFRPCKRCRPQEASAEDAHRRAVQRACELIASQDQPPSLDAMAAAAGISRHHFHRVFTRLVGTTPGAYARTVRLRRMGAALDAGTAVTEAVYAAGFGAASRAYAAADGMGMTPGARRRGGRGETIRHAIAPCVLGWLLLAVTQRGICALAFGDAPDELLGELRRSFPHAALVEDQDGLGEWIAALAAHLRSPVSTLELPLDVQGTAFQARVWQALRRIPPGSTRSYSEIAAALEMPKSVRAVARACASNQVALLIPCHRVVRGDGGLAGYRWGVARKQALLAAEDAASKHASTQAE